MNWIGHKVTHWNAKEVQEMFTEFVECSNRAGLTINLEKVTFVSNKSTNEFITVDISVISGISESKYLEQMITFEERQQRELERKKT